MYNVHAMIGRSSLRTHINSVEVDRSIKSHSPRRIRASSHKQCFTFFFAHKHTQIIVLAKLTFTFVPANFFLSNYVTFISANFKIGWKLNWFNVKKIHKVKMTKNSFNYLLIFAVSLYICQRARAPSSGNLNSICNAYV